MASPRSRPPLDGLTRSTSRREVPRGRHVGHGLQAHDLTGEVFGIPAVTNTLEVVPYGSI